MALWTDNTRPVGREGMLAETDYDPDIDSVYAEGQIRAGLLVQLSATVADAVRAVAALPAADDDAIVATPLASAVAAGHSGPALYDGVIGTGQALPPQRYSFTLNAHADWLQAAMSIMYEGPGGEQMVEDLLIPAGGGVTLYSHGVGSVMRDIWLPAAGGVNGTMDVGLDPTYFGVDKRQFPGIAIYDRMTDPSATATQTVDDEARISILRKGRIWVETETAAAIGDPVYVRMVEAGADLRGQFAADPDATNYCRLPGAHFITAAAADGVAIIEIGG